MVNAYRKPVKDAKGNKLSIRITILDTFNNKQYPITIRLRTNDNPRKELLTKESIISIEDYDNIAQRFLELDQLAEDILNEYNLLISGWEQVDYINRFNLNW
ncbi:MULTISPECIES: hypothetical protein [unclassified Clostridium]|uniref:hypothetical protein n=1 Tax=unclassified Clostridium TaxID=2614128 RepID=UPI00207AA08D|nr:MULTISPECIES: hypothetical protein [unclassified Clostridium]